MSPWGIGYVLANGFYWFLFLYWRDRYRPSTEAQLVGILHVFFAGMLDFPLRPLLDSGFRGWGIGFLQFHERGTALLATILLLGWALNAAWLAVARGKGLGMLWIAVGDWIWGLNIVWFQIQNLRRGLGQYDFWIETIHFRGVWAEIIVQLLFASAFSYAGRWAYGKSGVSLLRARAGRSGAGDG